MRELLVAARVARMATISPDGRPHLVPICFALDADTLYSAVDEKPKATTRLARLRNIRANPEVAVVADHYEEDWDRLWWVRVRGPARVEESGPDWERGVELLGAKYRQYRDWALESMTIVEIAEWRGWSAG